MSTKRVIIMIDGKGWILRKRVPPNPEELAEKFARGIKHLKERGEVIHHPGRSK